MRLVVLSTTTPRRRWLRFPWVWGGLLLVLSVLLLPLSRHPAAMLPESALAGRGPLVALMHPALLSPQTGQAANGCGVTDLSSCINDWITSFTKDTLAAQLKQQLDNITALGFFFQTPDSLTYNAQPVQEMYTYVLGVVGALLTFILAVAGFNHMTGRSTSWSETLPQVILCGVMAFGFQPFLAAFIQLSNDFIFGMQFAVGAQPTFPAYGGDAGNVFLDLLAFIVELLGDLLLALEGLARLALLDLLIALAPLGIICYALPQSRAWGRMWSEALAATILIQPIQAVLIMLGAKFISLIASFFQAGIPPIVQVLVGIASVYVALKVPTMLLSRATHVVSDFQEEFNKAAGMALRAAA